MPLVLSGDQPGLTVGEIQQRVADMYGGSMNSDRFKNMVLRWIQDIVRDIQLKDPLNRRTTVHDADFALIAGTTVYDVRDSVDDGGFGWDNCFEVLALRIPTLERRPLESLTLEQYRDRAYQEVQTGPPYAWVAIDSFRIRIVPEPDQAYAGLGDYRQNLPQLVDADAKVDWPRAWDQVINEGVDWKAMKQHEPMAVAAWMAQKGVYEEARAALRTHDLTSSVIPRKPVMTRRLSSRRVFHDNSTDRRGY